MNDQVVGLLFGGRSTEYEVSLKTTVFVLQHLSYPTRLIGIHPQTGQWFSHAEPLHPHTSCNLHDLDLWLHQNPASSLPPACLLSLQPLANTPFSLSSLVDVVFPLIHGADGEDGKAMAVLEFLQIPFVGSSFEGCVLTMNKILTKRLASSVDVPVLPDCVLLASSPNWQDPTLQTSLFETLQSSCLFVKVAHGGSSVGVFRVENQTQLHDALQNAFQYEQEVLIEPEIRAQEIFVGFFEPGLKNHSLFTVPGSFQVGFFDYAKKYHNPQPLVTHIPADLPPHIYTQLHLYCKKLFEILKIKGFARLDFWYQPEQQTIFLNEVNAIPGMTEKSLYPKLMSYEQFSHTEWLDTLVAYALPKHTVFRKLRKK